MRRNCKRLLHLTAIGSRRLSARNADATKKSDTTTAVSATRTNSTAGSTRSSKTATHERRRFLKNFDAVSDSRLVSNRHRLAAKLNADRSRQGTLVHAGWCGFRLPGAKSETQERSSSSSSDEDEPIHDFVAEQQLDGPLPGQHGVAMENETE